LGVKLEPINRRECAVDALQSGLCALTCPCEDTACEVQFLYCNRQSENVQNATCIVDQADRCSCLPPDKSCWNRRRRAMDPLRVGFGNSWSYSQSKWNTKEVLLSQINRVSGWEYFATCQGSHTMLKTHVVSMLI
jgi:hypothetical protein